MREFLPDLLNIVAPLLVAFVTYYATDWLLAYKQWAETLNPVFKRAVVVSVAGAVTLLAKWASVELPMDLAGWTPDTIDALVSAVLAMSVKAGNTAKVAKDDAAVAEQTAERAKHTATHAIAVANDAKIITHTLG